MNEQHLGIRRQLLIIIIQFSESMSNDFKPPSLFHSQRLVLDESSQGGNSPRSKFHAHKKMSFNGVSFSDHLNLNDEERKCSTPGPKMLTSSLRLSFQPRTGFDESSPESNKQTNNPFVEKLRQIKAAKSKKASSRAGDVDEEAQADLDDPSRLTFRQIKKKGSMGEEYQATETSN